VCFWCTVTAKARASRESWRRKSGEINQSRLRLNFALSGWENRRLQAKFCDRCYFRKRDFWPASKAGIKCRIRCAMTQEVNQQWQSPLLSIGKHEPTSRYLSACPDLDYFGLADYPPIKRGIIPCAARVERISTYRRPRRCLYCSPCPEKSQFLPTSARARRLVRPDLICYPLMRVAFPSRWARRLLQTFPCSLPASYGM
jgi:hypothetical protein